ncbi:factor of DNA methylation 1 [Manihot esculenta]|uniref:Factor of DNA methylation 1-5/IDN2 domain-containing protein n=1 Tax=Manihot esculenta TaxID=3983 RepID=A0A2C9W1G3_MANES|nr:factor of DNA methylation 1 [Manihot esculenta]
MKKSLNDELKTEKRNIEFWVRQWDLRESLIELERHKLDEESTMVKSKKEDALNKIRQLEKELETREELETRQKLELEIEELKWELEVMKKQLEDERDEAVRNVTMEMQQELDDLESLNATLIVKERRSNDELQDARKELIQGLRGTLSSTVIGIKRMGEIDEKPFLKTCKRRFPHEKAKVEASALCSLWQENLKNPEWHPFKIINYDYGKVEEIVDEEDEKLQNLKQEL